MHINHLIYLTTKIEGILQKNHLSKPQGYVQCNSFSYIQANKGRRGRDENTITSRLNNRQSHRNCERETEKKRKRERERDTFLSNTNTLSRTERKREREKEKGDICASVFSF